MIETHRFMSAFMSGYLLTMTGSLVQMSTSNPLASPSTLGVHAICLANYLLFFMAHHFFPHFFIWDWFSPEMMTSLSVLVYIFFIMKKSKSSNIYHSRFDLGSNRIILLGLCANLLIGAIFSILQFLMMAFRFELPSNLWFGSFKWSNSYLVWLLLVVCLTHIFAINANRKLMNYLELGPTYFLIHYPKTQIFKWVAISCLLVSFITVPYFGIFSFVGIVFPHIFRSLKLFTSYEQELIWGPVIGGLLFTLLDYGCYHFLLEGAEIPVGMLTGILGSLTLIFVTYKKAK